MNSALRQKKQEKYSKRSKKSRRAEASRGFPTQSAQPLLAAPGARAFASTNQTKEKKHDEAPMQPNQKTPPRERVFELNAEDLRMLRRIGLSIARSLNEQGRSVEQLAAELCIARSTLREIIAGRSNARILTLNSIARGLGYANLVDFLSKI
jgi:ribosome-binding protein aMBF1 (putative translation factor)